MVDALDTTGDGRIDTRRTDTTGDGQLDAVGFDTTGDGKIDAFDTTNDGRIDAWDTTVCLRASMPRCGSSVCSCICLGDRVIPSLTHSI